MLGALTALAVLALAPATFLLAAGIGRRWMDDDGFINLRVVRNILSGYGPVYNIGERVEVGTSPLWTWILALLGAIGVRLETAAVATGLACTIAGVLFGQLGACLSARWGSPSVAGFRMRVLVPVGVVVYAALPPAWDYATSGLENGLATAWIGASFLGLAWLGRFRQDGRRASPAPWFATAALAGLGPLVRPELALYSLALLVVLARGFDRSRRKEGAGARSRWSGLVLLVAAAGALPIGYELFRMGYYGAIAPNPAMAKEALLPNWDQGISYARNFFGLYALAIPLLVLFALWVDALRTSYLAGAWMMFELHAVLVLSAIVHAIYVVRVGGDYMHGRMFLLPVFAATLPVAMVPVRGEMSRLGRGLLAVALVGVLVWSIFCSLRIRVDQENQFGIGDERGWYARMAGVDNPVQIDDYRGFSFYESAVQSRRAIGNRRIVYVDDTSDGQLFPPRDAYPVARGLDPAVSSVTVFGAIGIAGYLVPSTVHVVDRHGLADPIAARLALEERGRPGHEKRLPNAWVVACFAEPAGMEDASVAAARRALRCGALQQIERATRSPLTFDRFFENIRRASGLQRTRIPRDPFDAERDLCGARELPRFTSGGNGGSPARWHCPEGTLLGGVRGSVNEEERSIAHIQPVCRLWHQDTALAGNAALVLGPELGEKKPEQPFDLECPADQVVVGLYGAATRFVHRIGLVCDRPRGSDPSIDPVPMWHRSAAAGDEVGNAFELRCPGGAAAIGWAGRTGALIDAAGVVCQAAVQR